MKASSFLSIKKTLMNQSLDKIQAQFINLSKLDHESFSGLVYVILSVSYAQIFFQTTQVARKYFPNLEDDSLPIFRAIENIFTFENIFSYHQYEASFIVALCFIFFYFVTIISSLLMTTYDSFRQKPIKSLPNTIWSLLIHTHGSVFFFPVNNLCNRFQTEFLNDTLQIFSSEASSAAIFYCSTIICIVNILFAVFPFVFLYDILPSPNKLSCKNSFVDKVTLLQKFLISCSITFLLDTPTISWLIMFFEAFFSIARHFWFLYTLPRYHFKTLHVDLQMISICSLSSLILLIIFASNQKLDDQITFPTFVIILLLLLPLTLIYAHGAYKKIIKEIVFKPFEALNPYKALHKILALKFLEESMKSPNRRTKRIDKHYFYFYTMQARLDNFMGKKSNNHVEEQIELGVKKDQNEIKRRYLENLVNYYKSDELKLMLAKFYAKNANLHILAFKTLTKIKSHSFSIKISTKLLNLEMQERILNRAKVKDHGDEEINLFEYFAIVSQKDGLKNLLKKQLDYQNHFWKEFNKNNPDIMELQKLSEIIHAQKQTISKKWSQMENQESRIYSHIYSLYGCYQFLLNDSVAKGKALFKKSDLFNSRQAAQQKGLSNSTLWDLNNVSITIRTHQESIGNILDCSNSIKKVLGYEKQDIIGSNIGSLMSHYIAEKHNTFIRDYIETGQTMFLGKIQTVFFKNRSGTLQKVSLWANIHPFVHQEVLITGLFQAIHDSKEYIFLTPQGEIDSYTVKIASKLGIQDKRVHISNICQNFANLFEVQNSNLLNQDQEYGRFASGEDVLQTGMLLLSKEKSQITNAFVSTPQIIFKLKEDQINCLLEFIPPLKSSNNFDNKTYSLQCEVKTVKLRESFMTVIEIEMMQEKDANKKENNHKISKNLSEELYNEDLSEEHSEESSNNYDPGMPELVSPERVSLQKDMKDSFNYKNKEEGTPTLSGNGNRVFIQDITETPKTNPTYDVVKRKLFVVNTMAKFKAKKNAKEGKGIQKAVEQSIAGSSTSLKDRKFTYIEDVFGVKYYPRRVKLFIVLLLVISLAILALELYLQIKINKDLNYSKAMAATIGMANLRADAFTQIARSARSAYLAYKGFAPKGSAQYQSFMLAFAATIQTNIPILQQTNAGLQLAILDIDQIFQDKFKAVDVRIYDINPDLTMGEFQKFNTFSAINVLIEKILRLRNFLLTKGTFLPEDLYYILINSVNDSLERTVDSIGLLLENTDLSFINTRNMIQLWKILYLSLLSVIVVITLWFYYHVYTLELKLVQQYLGISPQNVQIIRERLDFFDKILQSENMDELEEADLRPPSIFEKEVNAYDKRQAVKPQKAIKKKSLQHLYLKKIILFFSILVAYMIGIYFTLQEISDSIETMRLKIIGLTKTQSILYKTSMLTFAIGKLLSGDTIGTVRNRSPEEELIVDLNTFWAISYDLLEAFKEKDGTYDPLVSKFFFDDTCKFMYTLESKTNCISIVKDSKEFGLLSLFSRHYTLNLALYQDYKGTKTVSFVTYVTLMVRLIGTVTPSTGIIRELTQIMVDTIQANLTELWDKTNNNINIFLTCDPLFLLAMAIVNWVFMFRYFVDSFNRFKRMMRIVPLSILIRNPTLKGILMKSSYGRLQKLKLEE